MPNKKKTKKIVRSSAVPRQIRVFDRIYERTTTLLSSTAGYLVTQTVSISPAGIFSAGRLTGYQALRDQCRIEWVKVTLTPIFGADTEGQTGLYIERDPTAAALTGIPNVADQFESAVANVYRRLTITWTPQQPTDRLFNPLNPGTVVLAHVYVYGASIPASSPAYNMIVESMCTLRGRP